MRVVILDAAGRNAAAAATAACWHTTWASDLRDLLNSAAGGSDALILWLPRFSPEASAVCRLASAWCQAPTVVVGPDCDPGIRSFVEATCAEGFVALPTATTSLVGAVAEAARQRKHITSAGDLKLVCLTSRTIYDPTAAVLTRIDGAAVPLTPIEFRLLESLAKAPYQTISAKTLIAATWDDGDTGDRSRLYAHISGLRRKMGDASQSPILKARYGSGYSLHPFWIPPAWRGH